MPLSRAPGVLLNTSPVFDLVEGLEEVARLGLYETDDPDSHTRVVIEQVRQIGLHDRHREVVDLWLARDEGGEAVGMALITHEHMRGQWTPVLNLFVRPDFRGRGIGADLVMQTRQRHPRLEGHYTPHSVGIYHRLGVADFGRHRIQDPHQRQRAMEHQHRALQQEHAAMERTILPESSPLVDTWDPQMAPLGRAHRQGRRSRGR